MTILAVSGTPTLSLRPGISFARASSKWYSPLTISAVANDGLFGRSPLVPGVIVLTINDQEATWMHPDDAKSLVKSGESISITVEAFIAKIVRKKRLEKLGITLTEIKGEKGLLIEEIREESPFAKTDLKPGMKIININGNRCPNRPKEAIKMMQKIFGMMKVVAIQTNRDKAEERNQDEEVVMNWTKSLDSFNSKSKLQKAIHEAQMKRKVELKRKLSKQDDKFSKGLDKLESSLIRLESSVKGSTDMVRSRTENSETPLEVRNLMADQLESADQQNQLTESPTRKTTSEGKSLAEGYTIRKTGSFVCDIDEYDSEALESEKSSSKRFNFQNSPAAAISKLKKLGKKTKKHRPSQNETYDLDDDGTAMTASTKLGKKTKKNRSTRSVTCDLDDDTTTTTSTKYFNFDRQSPSETMATWKKLKKNFDQSPSEAMAKLKKLKKKKRTTPTPNHRRRKKKSNRKKVEGEKSPHRPRTVDFAGQVRKVSKKAREKIHSTISLSSANQEKDNAEAETKRQEGSSPMPRLSPSKGALTTIMSFGEREEENAELSKHLRGVRVVQTREDEMGMEICIAGDSIEATQSYGQLSVQGIVMIADSADDVVDNSDQNEAPKSAGNEDVSWPIQQVNTYDETALAFAGLKLVEPKRVSSQRNVKEAEENEVSESASKTVVMNIDSLTSQQQTACVQPKNDEEASAEEAPSDEDSIPSFLTGSDLDYYYSDELETDSEFDSDDFSGSEGEWSHDSPESVTENERIPSNTIHLKFSAAPDAGSQRQVETREQIPSQSGCGESMRDHMDSGREALHKNKSAPVDIIDSRDEGDEGFRVVTVCIMKASRDDILGFRIIKDDDRDGIFVSEIDQRSGLRHSGLEPGMQLTKVNGKECPNDFVEAVSVLKNTVGPVEIEAIAGLQSKNQFAENTLEECSNDFAESVGTRENAFSAAETQGTASLHKKKQQPAENEDSTAPELIVKQF